MANKHGHAGTCMAMQGHASTCKAMQDHAGTCKAMQGHAGTCKVMQGHVSPRMYAAHAQMLQRMHGTCGLLCERSGASTGMQSDAWLCGVRTDT
eukprot:359740-Chlamydomonas_euryale.AAC.7